MAVPPGENRAGSARGDTSPRSAKGESVSKDTRSSHHVSPRGRIDATPTGRHPLTPRQRRLVAALKTLLAKSGISYSKAGRIAGIDEGDARRVLAFGPTTPRTLRKLFETFNLNAEELSAADRREALLLEARAAAEKQADLLGELAALAANDPPEI